jgi:hypothetical protein
VPISKDELVGQVIKIIGSHHPQLLRMATTPLLAKEIVELIYTKTGRRGRGRPPGDGTKK